MKYESVWRKLLERSFPHAPFKNFNRGKKRDCFLRLLLTRRGRRLRRPELFQTIAAASSGGPLLADARHPFAEQMDSVPPPHPLHNICLPVGEGLGPSAAMAHRRTNGRIWNSPLRDSNTPVGEAISLPRRTQITTQAGRRRRSPRFAANPKNSPCSFSGTPAARHKSALRIYSVPRPLRDSKKLLPNANPSWACDICAQDGGRLPKQNPRRSSSERREERFPKAAGLWRVFLVRSLPRGKE